MTAKEYLKRYRTLNAYIDCKLEEVAQLRELSTRISPTAMFDRNGNVSDKVGHTAAKIVDLEREIDREVDELVEMRKEIEETISMIEDIDIRTVLEYRYINGFSWRRIAYTMHYSEDHVTCYLHRKALRAVDEIININGS
jgi:DNA-directed RNA polymerase specialized sigma24 family protein